MNQRSKLTQREHAEQEVAQSTVPQAAREFASVEDVLRHDAAQTVVPPALTRKIQAAAAILPAPKRAWWRQLFGR